MQNKLLVARFLGLSRSLASLSDGTVRVTAGREISRLIREANDANQKRNWADAERGYARVLRIDPVRPKIWVQYGHSLKEQGFLARAEEAYRKAISYDQTVADFHLQLGHLLKLCGRLEEAQSAYRETLLREPHQPDALREIDALQLELLSDEGHPTNADPQAAMRPRMKNTGYERDERFIRVVYGADAMEREIEYKSLEHLLHRFDLSADFLEIFDFNFYFYTQGSVRVDIVSPDFYRCVKHFCENGIDRLLAIDRANQFDADFYLETYIDHPFTPANAYRHWLNVGLKRGFAANRGRWLRSTFGEEMSGFKYLDIELYMSESEKSAAPRWIDKVKWFANEGVESHLLPSMITPPLAEVLATIADDLVIKAQEGKASRLYQKVLSQCPDNERAQNHYADILLRSGNFLAATDIYRRLAACGSNIWAHINLAVSYEDLSNWGMALTVLRDGVHAHPGDLGIRRRFDQLAEKFLQQSSHIAKELAKIDRADAAQKRIAQDLAKVSELIDLGERLPHRKIGSVAILGSYPLPQCHFYRIDQKLEQFDSHGLKARYFDVADGLDCLTGTLQYFDAVIFYRVQATYEIMVLMQQANSLGLVTFYEIDDLLFDPTEFPESFKSYAGQISREDYAELQLGVPRLAHAMSLCQYGIASTPPLAAHMRKLVQSGTVFVHRNALGRLQEAYLAQPTTRGAADTVTIFYGSGTKAHKQDFQDLIEPALVEMVRRYRGKISVVLMGYMTMSDRLRTIEDHLVLLPPVWDVNAYWVVLAKADINVAVLEPSPVSHCKSEIKWLEAAMFGIPSVVSETETYRDVIVEGETGFMCRNTAEWVTALDRLIGDPALRQRIGNEARRVAAARYGLKAMAKNIGDIFTQVAPSRPERRRPKVLVVNVFYPPQALGGATRVVHDNITHLKETHDDRFEIEVFTSLEGGTTAYEFTPYAQGGVRVVAATASLVPDLEALTLDPKMGEAFGRFLDETRPDLIHFHCIQRLTASIVLAAGERQIPYLITVHDGWWISDTQFLLGADGKLRLFDYDNPIGSLQKLGESAFRRLNDLRPALFGAARVLAVSNSFAEVYRKCGVPNVLAIPNGVSDLPVVARKPSQSGKVRLAFIGGISPHKGCHLIEYALCSEKFANIELLVIDHAMKLSAMREEEWGTTKVRMQPKTPQNQVAGLYAEIDVLLAPSVWPESYGLVTREALRAGCWVVASRRGSTADDIDDGVNGFVIDVEGPDDLVRVLRAIDADPERFQHSPPPVAAMRHARQQADDLVEVYDAVLAEHVAGRDGRTTGSPGNIDAARASGRAA